MQSILDKIIADKRLWVAERMRQQPLASFQDKITPSTRSFYQALSGPRAAFILECKKASPSKGCLRPDFDPAYIANIYKHYAAVISVLTDEPYFQGRFEFLPIVSAAAPQPVLCKDFIISAYQIYLARYYQADACLLMLSVLSDDEYCTLSALAARLKMGVLTEVSTPAELARARKLHAKVVGINNRDLRDLSIDLNRTRQLAQDLGKDVVVISESGFNSYKQLRALRPFAKGFLIGSALMAQQNLDQALRGLVLGKNKVCGLTRAEDAQAALKAGALYGGLIFVPSSPRYVSESQALEICKEAALRYVGVFREAPLEAVVETAKQLRLHAVQLHGNEDQAYITNLRKVLPDSVKIWKAMAVKGHLPARDLNHIDRYVFDNGAGGSGQRFDWSLLKGQDLHNVLLAGGLGPDHCAQAAELGCAGLDFNSGLESQPGLKDLHKLNQVFQILRDY